MGPSRPCLPRLKSTPSSATPRRSDSRAIPFWELTRTAASLRVDSLPGRPEGTRPYTDHGRNAGRVPGRKKPRQDALRSSGQAGDTGIPDLELAAGWLPGLKALLANGRCPSNRNVAQARKTGPVRHPILASTNPFF